MRKLKAAVAAAVGVIAVTGAGSAMPAPAANQMVDMRVLLVSAYGGEPALLAWQQELGREGVPYDTVVADTAAPITDTTLADGTTHARYEAVVFADDIVPTTLAPQELTAIRTFEATFGLREVSGFSYPSADEGLNPPSAGGPMSSLGTSATLTTAGRSVFPYLRGPVSYEGVVWGYLATPVAGAAFTPLVTGANGSSLVGVYRRADGVEQMVSTVAVGPSMTHGDLLLRGMVDWATGRVHLGLWRNYLGFHVDDIFAADDRWDVNANMTPEDGVTCTSDGTDPLPPCSTKAIRMTATDVQRAASWSRNNVRLDFVFNGAGRDDAVADNGTDPLSNALISNRSAFGWINHTYSHMNLDNATQAQIAGEITTNIAFATRWGLPINRRELVTGEHSGLANPAMPAALDQTGIRVTGSDNSRQPQPYAIGGAVTLPRYPSNIYYNVGTRAEQLDEYNYVYFQGCTNTAVTTCLTAPATWQQYVDAETTIMLRHVLNNDPRPHYVHQSNLAEDGTLYLVANPVLAKYRSWFSAPLVTPTMTQASQELARQSAWASALSSGQVRAWRLGSFAYVQSSAPATVQVPLSGILFGQSYGGGRSGWATLPSGATIAVAIG